MRMRMRRGIIEAEPDIASNVDDSDDTAEDDREDEEDARARELVGYVDLRETPFDVQAELKISKDNSNPGEARGVSSRSHQVASR